MVDVDGETTCEKHENKRKGRAKGSGWLVKRGSNWYAFWKHNGKLYKRTTGTGKKDKAWEILEEFTRVYRLKDERQSFAALAAKVETAENLMRAEFDKRPSLTLVEAWEIYKPVLRQKLQPGTAKSEDYRFNTLTEWLGKQYPEVKEAREVTRRMAREFYDFLLSKTIPYTAGRYLSTFSRLWEMLRERDEIQKEEIGEDVELLEKFKAARITGNPWKSVDRKSNTKSFSRRELTIEELNKVYNSTSGEMRLLFGIGIYTGLRLGDCASLDWGKIDMVRGYIALTPRKTKESSGVTIREAIPRPLYEMLSEIEAEKRFGYVLPNIADKYKSNPVKLCLSIQDVFHRCGIETSVELLKGKRKRTLVGFHSLRHTYVSMVLNRGGNLSVVQKTVGHTTSAMTEHYLHLDETALKATAALLPDIRTEGKEQEGEKAEIDFATVYKQIDSMGRAELEQLKAHIEKRILDMRFNV